MNIYRKAFAAAAVASFILCPSCSKDRRGILDHGGRAALGLDSEKAPVQNVVLDFSDPGDFFTLDYTPQTAEGEENSTEHIEESTGEKAKGAYNSSGGNKKTVEKKERSLDSYMTKYSTAAPPVSSIKDGKGSAPFAAADGKESFTIIDWGPQGAIPAQVRFPSFYVLFSEGVIPLAALGEVSSTSAYMKIEPAIKGTFRWKGTSLLTFDATEAADPMTQYTITVTDGMKSVWGKVLSGERVFRTTAAALNTRWMALGKAEDYGIDIFDAPIAAAKRIRVCFNYAVHSQTIAGLSQIIAAGKAYEFTASQEKIDTVAFDIKEDFPLDTDVILRIKQPGSANDGAKDLELKIHTLRPLAFVSYSSNYSSGVKSNPVRLAFSHPLDAASAAEAVSAKSGELPIAVTKDNIEVSGNCITVFGLDVKPHTKYTLSVSSALRDVWGQPLNGGKEVEVTVPGMPSIARFAEGGAKMLEAQFPHKVIFEYQNALPGSRYKACITDAPLSPFDWNNRLKDDALDTESTSVLLDVSERDKRILKTVNFDECLKEGESAAGKAFRFDAAIKLPKEATRWDKSTQWTATNTTTVQITDLGITARFGVNKVAAMVSSLSTGKAIEGAVVNVYHKSARHKTGGEEVIGTASTNKAGLAVIDIEPNTAEKLYRDDADDPSDDSWYGSVVLEAVLFDGEDIKDRAIFVPDSHSSWRDGVDQASIKDAYSEKPRIFMFSDRGLYKPGETISFRGIDRNQKLGAFIPYKGNYKVELRSAAWRDDKVYAVVTGEVSEEGGFAGSFMAASDMEPGSYYMVYTRCEKEETADTEEGGGGEEMPEAKASESAVSKSVPIMVSFFERLRFQCGITMPSVPVITGAKVGALLNASYLSGGVLSGAQVTSRWYREPWYFTSNDAAFKGYRFGPIVSGSRQIVTSGKGSLDANGALQLVCETAGESLKGVPYRYRLSCDVMDESNQAISAAGITVVHPASCYLGLSGPEGVATFPKAEDALNFSYKWASLDGTPLNNASSMLGASKKMTVTLLRDEWNVVKQQGVSGYIYNRYEKTQIEESTATVAAEDTGKITVTPLKPGSHTLRVQTTDAAGRDIVTESTFYATGSGVVSWYNDDATAIRLTPNKARYTPGETATLLIESPLPKGDYLITVEREGIFSQEVRHFEGNVNTIEVKVARNFLPVAYVCVSSYSVRTGEPKHQYGEIDLDKPKGYYGVSPIFIDPRVKSFTIKTESKKTFRPGEEAEVTLAASKDGKPLANAELTLMAVDRGVLDLIDYHVDDPVSFFYSTGNFPLRVLGGDSRAMLMDPVTYTVNNLAGGDALMKSAAADKLEERKDFNPTAAFIPVIKTDENGKATAKFKLPDTLTSYRLTAFGVKGELLSLQEDEIAVQNPINVQQVLPRRMRERDTAEVGVLVTNLDSETREVNVSLEFNAEGIKDTDGVLERAGRAAVDGKAEKKVSLITGESKMVCFDAAAIKAGAVNAVFTIKSDVLNERLIAPLVIERPYIFETVTTTGSVTDDGGGGENAAEQVVLPSMADNGKGSMAVTLDATRLGLLGGAVQYLFDYPYGCMEQQASKLLPLVVFGEYIDVFGLNSEVKDIKKCVISVFKGWKQSQLPAGGFGYWADARYPDLYVSCRIAHTAALALKRGYSKEELYIDIDALSSYIEKAVSGYSEGVFVDGYSRAYALYVLSLLGKKADEGVLRKLCEGEETSVSILSFCGMASFMQERGEDFATECAKRIRSFIRPTAQGADLTDPRGNVSALWCFYDGSSERLALAMQLFTMLNKDDAMIGRLLFQLLSNQRRGYWQSTAQTARVLDAFYTLIKAQNIDATDLTASVALGNTKLLEASFKGAQAKPVTAAEELGGKALGKMPRDTLLPLKIDRQGKGNLYYTASLRYALPEERQSPRDEGICVSSIIYDNATGEEIKAAKNSTVISLESGKTYRMVLELSTTYDRAYVAIRAPIPSGAEILDASFVTTSDEAREGRPKSQADKDREAFEGTYYGGHHYLTSRVILDNEVQFFYDRFGRGRDSVEFVFRATRSGVYPTPPAAAECMYEEEVFGRTGGTLFVIK